MSVCFSICLQLVYIEAFFQIRFITRLDLLTCGPRILIDFTHYQHSSSFVPNDPQSPMVNLRTLNQFTESVINPVVLYSYFGGITHCMQERIPVMEGKGGDWAGKEIPNVIVTQIYDNPPPCKFSICTHTCRGDALFVLRTFPHARFFCFSLARFRGLAEICEKFANS